MAEETIAIITAKTLFLKKSNIGRNQFLKNDSKTKSYNVVRNFTYQSLHVDLREDVG